MPRHDWKDDDTMTRDRSDWRERGFSSGRMDDDYRDRDRIRDRGAMFDRNDYRGESRSRIGGWGPLDDDRSRSRRDHAEDRDRWYGSDDHNRGVPMDETKRLIASNKVEGTPVFDRHGDKMGSIHNFMVDKMRGEVVYAVMKHGGGFLGLNERYYPIEWSELTYDTRLNGYHVNMDEEDLDSFGSFDSDGRYHRRRPRGRQYSDRSERW